jgi:hypothetical protein
MQSYTMGRPRSMASQVLASTSVFMQLVNTLVAGALGALVADAAGGAPAVLAVAGTVTGLAHLGVSGTVFQAVGPPAVGPAEVSHAG